MPKKNFENITRKELSVLNITRKAFAPRKKT
jgi:hypothetical protein